MGPKLSVSIRVSAIRTLRLAFLATGRSMETTAITVIFMLLVRMRTDIGRHVGNMAVAHAALRNDVIRERLHLVALALEHGYFETTIMIEMNVESRLCESMVRVEIL